MNSGEGWRLGRRPALDGLRGVAILLVIVNHIGVPNGGHTGQVGVGAFFVLSGFLITSLLLEEWNESGRIRLAAFYARRALRLAPALIVCVSVVWSFATFVNIPMGTGGGPAALLYVMDFVQASHAVFQPGLLAHTWSLAVEEQFYLLWPLVLIGALRLRVRLVPALIGAAAISATWSLALIAAGAPLSRVVYAPDTRAVGLLTGCALAAAFTTRAPARLPRPVLVGAIAALVVLGWGPTAFGISDPVQMVLTVPVAAVIVWGCADGGPVGALASRWLRGLGARSYGVYLWHLPLIGIATFAMPTAPWWARAIVALTLTAGIVELSWRLVEQPCLRLKPRSGHAGYAPKELVRRDVLGRGAVGA